MRLKCALLLCLSGMIVLPMAPSGHAAGYTQYVSPHCRYVLSYPNGWTVRTKGVSTTFTVGRGRTFALISVACVKGMSIRRVTASGINVFKKRGFAMSRPTYSQQYASEFTGQGVIGSTAIAVHSANIVNPRTGGVLTYLLTPVAIYGRMNPLYQHLVSSFRLKK